MEFAEVLRPELPRTPSKLSTDDLNVCNLWIMQLPVNPPILPMLAKRVSDLPTAGDWIFEPKWDGFRALVFRDGKEVMIQSRDESR